VSIGLKLLNGFKALRYDGITALRHDGIKALRLHGIMTFSPSHLHTFTPSRLHAFRYSPVIYRLLQKKKDIYLIKLCKLKKFSHFCTF